MPDFQAKPAISQNEMIRASAGSGKTFQLTNRYIGLMAHGVDPEKIIALTFTRKAAGEFFDAILEKLSRAATDPDYCAELANTPYIPDLPPSAFLKLLRKLVSRMHLLTLGTLDSFFSSILRNFPFEFGLGGGFEILDDHLFSNEQLRVYRQVFQRPHAGASLKEQQDFLVAFKLATFGSEESRLVHKLGRFIDDHHDIYLNAPGPARWGNQATIWPDGWRWGSESGDLNSVFKPLIDSLRADPDLSEKQLARWTNFRDKAITHRPGTPMAKEIDYILIKALEQLSQLENGEGKITVERKKQELTPPQAEHLAEISRRLVNAELENLLSRTRGVFQVIHEYERSYGRLVRRRGKLTFSDLLIILTSNAADDANGFTSPLLSQTPDSDRRLGIDYRLDARFDHWLLDEFQDTNFLQWRTIENLIDETVQDTSGQRTLFQVGDVKQAIYGWRGGDVRLFDEIHDRYTDEDGTSRIKKRHLDRSYRSGPDIIGMVNNVFSDSASLEKICPPSTLVRWEEEWRDHASNFPDREGYACLLNPDPGIGKKKADQDDIFATMLSVLEEVRPDQRRISCAILVQGNATAKKIVDYVRTNSNIPIFSESDFNIATDNPLTLALLSLFQFAAHPGDTFAWNHLRMTPFGKIMDAEKKSQADVAAEILGDISRHGTERVINRWLDRLELELDEFSQRRAGEFARAAQSFDQTGSKNLEEFLDFAENYTVREPAAEGTVQVMTIHKSKGLGFQMCLLPELDGNKLAMARDGIGTYRNEDRSIEWVYTLPKNNIARQDPVLAAYVEQQEADNCYESLCKFYVAMTRAKRAMYLIAPAHGKSTSANFVKLLESTLSTSEPKPGKHHDQIVYQGGNEKWYEAGDIDEPKPKAIIQKAAPATLPESARRPRHRRRTPSGSHAIGTLTSAQIFSPSGTSALTHGLLVHALFEQIEWLDETTLAEIKKRWDETVPDATKAMRQEVLDSLDAAAPILNRPSPTATCWREKRFETLIDGDWISGTIDRVILDGERATIIDFKTTELEENTPPSQAAAKYQQQLNTYHAVVQKMTGLQEQNIKCYLFFTKTELLIQAAADAR
ncbi:MAG: ATP-dependent helicase/nuclease subunit A [Verrucomicrobiales bacterium]|jgi:ATP-dependent helicase/nuclease subunit A